MVARQQQLTDFSMLPAELSEWPPEDTATIILAIATTLDDLMATGQQPADALKRLEKSMPGLPREIIDAVRAVHLHSAYMDICWVGIEELRPGMVLDEDIIADNGETLMFRGEEITSPLLTQLRTATTVTSAGESLSVSQKLRILMPA
jgi:hypothetical protein